MKTNTLFQMSLEQAYALHRNMSKSDMGETHHIEWVKLCKMLGTSAYDAWADTHDQAGNPMQVVNPEQAQVHNDILFELLRNVVKTIGEVKFSDEHTALLDVNADFAELTRNASRKLGWKKSVELQSIEDDICDLKLDLQFAQEDFERYNFNGVSKETKAEKQAIVDKLQAQMDNLKEQKKEAEKQNYGKVRVYVPCSESEFRKNFETLIHDMIEGQNAIPYTVYRAQKEEQRKARRARTKAKKEARKAAEEQAQA